MKTKITMLIFLIAAMGFTQNGINYKAVIKDDLGNIVANDLIVVQFAILQGVSQTNVYTESHAPTTDDHGIIVINIGEGTPISGTFTSIDWASDDHFLNVQMNTGGGLTDMGTTQFKSVPYAMVASHIALPYFGSISQSGAAFHAHNDFINGRYGLAGSVGTDGETLPANNAGVMGNGVGGHGVYGFSKTGFYAGVQGVSDAPSGVGVQGYGFGGGVGGHFYTTSTGKAALTTGPGNVGLGIGDPVNPLSVLQTTGTANTVRIESKEHTINKDLLELIVPSGTTASSQFIEMQNGNTIVAAVNSDGSAKFKSVQFEDNSVQTKAAIGPLAFGSISSAGTVSSGSGNYSAIWSAANSRYEISITSENYHYSLFTTVITPVTIGVRSFETSSVSGKLLVHLYNAAGSPIQGNFHFITYK